MGIFLECPQCHSQDWHYYSTSRKETYRKCKKCGWKMLIDTNARESFPPPSEHTADQQKQDRRKG